MDLLDAWSAMRTRRVVVNAIAPMVACSRRRLGAIPPARWREPYMIGFLTMLISLFAQRRARSAISSERLGLLQGNAWQDLTGLPDDRIGEDVCLLSAEYDREFVGGCIAAARFAEAYYGRHDPLDPEILDVIGSEWAYAQCPPDADDLRVFGNNGAIASALWARYFEDRVR